MPDESDEEQDQELDAGVDEALADEQEDDSEDGKARPRPAGEPSPAAVYQHAFKVTHRFKSSLSKQEREEVAQEATIKWWRLPAEKQAAVRKWKRFVSTITLNLCRSLFNRNTNYAGKLIQMGAVRPSRVEPGERNEERRHKASDGAVYSEGEDDALASIVFEEWLEEHQQILGQLSNEERVVLAVRARVYLGEVEKDDAPALASRELNRASPYTETAFQIAASRAQARLIELLAAADPSWKRVWWTDVMHLHGKRAVGYLKRTIATEKKRKKARRIPTGPELGAAAVWFLATGRELDPAARLPIAASVAGRIMSERLLTAARQDLFDALEEATVGPYLTDRVLAVYVLDKWPVAREAQAAWKNSHA